MKVIEHYHEGCEKEMARDHAVYKVTIKYYKISREHSDETHIHYFACTNEEMLVLLVQILATDKYLGVERIEITRI